MVRVKDGAYEAGNDVLPKTFFEQVGFKRSEIKNTTTSNKASKGITTIFNHDKDLCDMHDYDKIGRSAIGYLIKTRNKVQCFLIFAEF